MVKIYKTLIGKINVLNAAVKLLKVPGASGRAEHPEIESLNAR